MADHRTKRAKRTIEVYDLCTSPGCDNELRSIKEGVSGVCVTCWAKSLPPELREKLERIARTVMAKVVERGKQAPDRPGV